MADNYADSQFSKKLEHEEDIKKDLKEYFKKVIAYFLEYITFEVSSPDLLFFNPEIRKILSNHYDRVYDDFAFNSDIVNRESLTPLQLQKFKQDKQEFIENAAAQRGFFISQTNTKEARKAFLKALFTFASISGSQNFYLDLNDKNQLDLFAKLSADILTERTDSRIDTIAITETQYPAESSKDYMAGFFLASDSTRKIWITKLDERVRLMHSEAHGQTQEVKSPFIVGGQKLMYPGDTGLGATAKNIINCRCAARYFQV